MPGKLLPTSTQSFYRTRAKLWCWAGGKASVRKAEKLVEGKLASVQIAVRRAG